MWVRLYNCTAAKLVKFGVKEFSRRVIEVPRGIIVHTSRSSVHGNIEPFTMGRSFRAAKEIVINGSGSRGFFAEQTKHNKHNLSKEVLQGTCSEACAPCTLMSRQRQNSLWYFAQIIKKFFVHFTIDYYAIFTTLYVDFLVKCMV